MSYEDDFDSLFQEQPGPQPSPGLSTDAVRHIATDTTLRTLQALQAGVAQIQQNVADARQRAEKNHPGFEKLYGDVEICQRFIKERPVAARQILNAEAGYGGPEDLDELYHSFYNAVSMWETAPQPSNSGRRANVKRLASASELSLQQINAIPVEKRRATIEALRNRVGDMPLDEADPSNEVFKKERGE
jgi:hypothetical protein